MRTMYYANHPALKTDVIEHIILKNGWEYYVKDYDINDPDLGFGLVCGFEQEFGYFSLNELRPFIVSRTKKLNELMPAKGYRWETENVTED